MGAGCCCGSGCTGRIPGSPSVATAIMAGRRPWTGANGTMFNTSSACPPMQRWPRWWRRRPTRCAPDGPPGRTRQCATTPNSTCRARSWSRPRRVVARIEATPLGLDIRYVVTNIVHCAPRWIYDSLYCARGEAENLIKRHKSQLASDRTSCCSPLAHQMRLFLHTVAYWLMRTVQEAVPAPQPLASGDFNSLRLRLLKVTVRIQETASRVRLAFTAACPDAALFRGLVATLILRPI
jgi:hypothetical protein